METQSPVLTTVKKMIRDIPGVGPLLVRLRGGARPGSNFTNSSEYWDNRYRKGGNSGAGSYNRLAEFKADVLNGFVRDHQVASVIEFGSGDGAQLARAQYPDYIGIDVSPKAVELCRETFQSDPSKMFFTTDAVSERMRAELSLSLDVIYHLVEDPVFDEYMRRLFAAASRHVIVYSSNMDKTWPASHVRHRQFTRWVEQNMRAWTLVEVVKNKYPYDDSDPDHTSFADFFIFAKR